MAQPIKESLMAKAQPDSLRILFFRDQSTDFAVRVTVWTGAKAHGIELFRVEEVDGVKTLIPVSRGDKISGVKFPPIK